MRTETRDPAWGKRGYRMSLSLHVLLSRSELVAETDTGVVRGSLVAARCVDAASCSAIRLEETVGETVLHLRPHHAGVHVDVLGEAPIDDQRDSVEGARALRGPCIGTARNCARPEAVLPFVVIGTGDVEGRRDRIASADPGRLQNLVVGEVCIVHGPGDKSAGQERAGIQRIVRIGEVDVLVAAPELPRADDVPCTDAENGVVGDGRRDQTVAGTYRSCRRRGSCQLGLRQNSGRNRVIDLAAEEIEREAHVVETDIALEGVAGRAVATVAELRFNRQTNRTDARPIFGGIAEKAILG